MLLFPGGNVRNGRQAGKFLQPLPGTITGAGNGVEILGAIGSVSNIGTIAGATGYGVWLAAGGAVTNSYGTIEGHRTGVLIQNGPGTVSNLAVIESSGAGVKLTGGGTVINGHAGSTAGYIGGGKAAVAISGASGLVSNFGFIDGSTQGVALAAGGAVINHRMISGVLVGVEADAPASVSNYGTIFTPNSYGVLLKAGGRVDNAAGALIRSPEQAVAITNGAGSVTNLGTIAAQLYLAVYLTSGNLTNGASGSDAGLLQAYFEAVRIGGTTSGTIDNFGTIIATGTTSTLGVVLFAGALTNAGLIHGSLDGVSVITNGTIDNLGTIAGTAPSQSGSYGVSVQGSGAVTNGASGSDAGLIAGDGGVNIEDAGGTVVNFGLIEGAGSIAAYWGAGVRLQDTGAVANYGTIAGAGADLHGLKFGIECDGGGSVTNGGGNTPGALIVGGDGVHIGGAEATVRNFGTIIGFGTLNGALYLDGRGVYLKAGGAIVNSGTIETTATGVSAQGIYLLAGGSILNQGGAAAGRIIGYEQGVFIAGAGGRVTNYGTVAITGTGMQSFGIYLHEGGHVRNGATGAAAASVSGYNAGIYNTNAPATIVNFGTIAATGVFGRGVDLSQGLVVRNGASGVAAALITAADYGVRMPDAPGIVTNFATITATGSTGTGLYLGDGGTLSNGRSGLIDGAAFGVHTAGAAAAVSDLGRIAATGSNGVGVSLGAGGSVTVGANGATGAAVAGGVGVKIGGGSGTVANFGTITGTGGRAVQFGGGDDRLVVEPGAVFIGAAGRPGKAAGGGGGNTIELAGTALGIFRGLRTQFVDFATVTVDAGADWQVDVTPTSLAGEKITGAGGKNQLVLTAAGTFNLAKISGFRIVRVANAGPYLVTFANANFTGVPGKKITFFGGNGGNMVTANSLAVGDALDLRGGSGADFLKLSAPTLAISTVAGATGGDTLDVTTAGTIKVTGVSGVEIYQLASSSINTLTLQNTNFAGVSGRTITVAGGSKGNTVNASGLNGSNRVVVVGGAGKDIVTGGAGSDIFEFSVAALADTDIVKGGSGTDKLMMTTAGAILAGRVSGVETYVLARNRANTLTLINESFAGVSGKAITVDGGAKGNTISEAGVPVADRAVIRGGAGADILIAGRHASMKGSAGADLFELTTPGSVASPDQNTIADFSHGTDKIAFSEKGFGLGSKPVAPRLFAANKTGGFTTSAQRFVYDTTNGKLFYDAHGNAPSSPHELIATLTGDPTLTAGDVRFVS